MSAPRRDVEAFARTVEALGPKLDDLVFIGGWAHYPYTMMPEAGPLGFTPLTTEDADIAAPLRWRIRGKPIADLLVAAGFEQRLSGDHIPPVAEYALGDEESGFYVEFLAPLAGGEVKRGGRPDVTAKVGGVSAQKLRHLDILLVEPWAITLMREQGFRSPGHGRSASRIQRATSTTAERLGAAPQHPEAVEGRVVGSSGSRREASARLRRRPADPPKSSSAQSLGLIRWGTRGRGAC